ncbi:epimerase [Nitrosopumilus oxyclinae]|uniref:Epimerase n=1 Tax=Nitrosopumilus oxyclinae TaxID=1959104 RepID=A0A7D5R2J5_9ARCH|nr:SDR family NAD(P)-dependent oxidoreductase [Nitrosopumilus oxyclinae]QLH04017.1 epimerase [Nitrosopumilus oxyclinae]
MSRVALVTGGAGFIGSHLVKKLLHENYKVIVYDDLSNGSGKKNLPKKINFIKGSILNEAKFAKSCSKADVVFNLAVKPLPMSFDNPEEVVKVNGLGTLIVAKTCTQLKKKLIHVSSSESYGTAQNVPMNESHTFFPTTVYAASKAASEYYVQSLHESDGLKMVIVRPFNCYGPYMRDDVYAAAIPNFYHRITKRKPPIIFGNGKQTRDLTYVEDTVNGIFLADKRTKAIGKALNIGQGKETSINQVAKMMIKQYSGITETSVSSKILYKKERKGDVRRHFADISYAKKILGYKPQISLEEGVNKYLQWALNE